MCCASSATVPSATALAAVELSTTASARAVDSEGGAEVGWDAGVCWRLGCSATDRTTPGGGSAGRRRSAPAGPPGLRRSPPIHPQVYLLGVSATRSPQPLTPCLRPVHT